VAGLAAVDYGGVLNACALQQEAEVAGGSRNADDRRYGGDGDGSQRIPTQLPAPKRILSVSSWITVLSLAPL
jgi:hypothetical protein